MDHVFGGRADAGLVQDEIHPVRARQHGRLDADFPIGVRELGQRLLNAFGFGAVVFWSHGSLS
ncbi:hypothetical protein D3C80_1749500 [compost metagenome]